jgi:hypothetical protein
MTTIRKSNLSTEKNGADLTLRVVTRDRAATGARKALWCGWVTLGAGLF